LLKRQAQKSQESKPNNSGRLNFGASAANRLERISNLSVEEFISEYLQKNRPVIVTGAMVHWKALETWNPDALASRFGNERVQVYGDLFRLAAITTLSEYLKKYFGCSSSSPGSVPYVRWYCHLANDERVPWADEVFAKFQDDWSRPVFSRTILLFCRTVLQMAELIQAGIGFQPAGCSSRPVARVLDCMPIPGAAMRFFAKFSERRNL